MSGGVDSSVAAALLVEDGHEVMGVTLKLWGGESDSGCCSVSDVEDARRVAAQIGIPHYVFNFSDDFDAHVVEPYARAYAGGSTPNPCVECNRHLKWGRLFDRAEQLGFDFLATGHHARIDRDAGGVRLRRGADARKDQSYVLARLERRQMERTLLPLGALTKAAVRERAGRLGLRTAMKPDSMDVCFITRGDRVAFVDRREAPTPGVLVDTSGAVLGDHDGVRRFTIGQRRGLGVAAGERCYVVDIDAHASVVTVGRRDDLLCSVIPVVDVTFVHRRPAPDTALDVQTSAHGTPVPARLEGHSVLLDAAVPRIAPGQLVAFYAGDEVVGAATAA
jgi:tRNA-specific 2-thiouridylase